MSSHPLSAKRSGFAVGVALSLRGEAAMVLSLTLRLCAAEQTMPAATISPVAVLPGAVDSPGETTRPRRIVREGIAVDFDAEAVVPSSNPAVSFREGDDVRFRFKITDTATGRPVTGAYPAAWMDLVPAGMKDDPTSSSKKAAAFLSQGLLSRPALDLNAYQVLALNGDATITVVDPLFGFGGTKLLALVQLRSPGEDWALTLDQTKLFVSMPDANRIAVVSAGSWQVIGELDAGPRPTRMACQPDGHFIWAATGELDGAAGAGVTVVDAEKLTVAAKIPTGVGRHEIAFDEQGKFAFVTSAGAGTVSVIDIRSLAKIKEIPTGREPAAIAFSAKAQMVYVLDAKDGNISVISADRHKVLTRIAVAPGPGQIKFAPDGRFGFVVSSGMRAVLIIDSATNRIIQTDILENEPDQLAFSDEFAYIHQQRSATVVMIPLSQVGLEGHRASLAEFPGGQNAPGHVGRLTRADAIVRAPGQRAVLVANPADKTVYLYEEGMAAPKGSFGNYDRQPRAVAVVDRSLRERSTAGVYETIARVGSPGRYDLVFFLDVPRMAHSFQLVVGERAGSVPRKSADSIHVEVMERPQKVEAGKQVRLEFKLTGGGRPIPGSQLTDLTALAMLAPGVWHHRVRAEVTEGGLCAVVFTPPQAGFYYLYLKCPSLDIEYRQLPNVAVFEATDASQ